MKISVRDSNTDAGKLKQIATNGWELCYAGEFMIDSQWGEIIFYFLEFWKRKLLYVKSFNGFFLYFIAKS